MNIDNGVYWREYDA